MIDLILSNPYVSWVEHFMLFFILSRYSGIKPAWAVGLVLFVEIWEALDWAMPFPWNWFALLDTWADMVFGCVAVVIASVLPRGDAAVKTGTTHYWEDWDF